MPEPHPRHDLREVRRVAWIALIAGTALFALKLGVFAVTNSAAVLSDALESIVNLVAAGVMLYTLWLSGRPPDVDHQYGHGKAEFLAVAFEGSMVLFAAGIIAYEAIARLWSPPTLSNLSLGVWLVGGVAALTAALGLFVYVSGKRKGSAVLIADGKHLLTDASSTIAALLALIAVDLTGAKWIDAVVALGMAAFILWTGAGMLKGSIDGLMDRSDPRDRGRIEAILRDETARGAIAGFHKVRHRRNGEFCWVDMHIQVDPDMSVRDSHALASRIEHRIEEALGEANATAHVEPAEQQHTE